MRHLMVSLGLGVLTWVAIPAQAAPPKAVSTGHRDGVALKAAQNRGTVKSLSEGTHCKTARPVASAGKKVTAQPARKKTALNSAVSTGVNARKTAASRSIQAKSFMFSDSPDVKQEESPSPGSGASESEQAKRRNAMFHYTLESDAPFDQVVKAIEAEAPKQGFRVLHVHDVTKTLAEKGFEMVPLKIIEVCSAKYAKQALDADRMVSLMMPCRISVWSEGGKTHISTIRPEVISEFYPGKGLESFAGEVGKALKAMMDTAASSKG